MDHPRTGCRLGLIVASPAVGSILIVELRFRLMRFALVLTVVLAAACLVAAVLVWPLWDVDPDLVDVVPPAESLVPEVVSNTEPLEFLGAVACRGCHQEMFDGFAQTAHHLTSVLPTEKTMLGTFPAVMKTANPDLHFELDQTEEGFFQSAVGFRNGRADRQRQRIDLVVGSGKLGQSFLYWRENRFGGHELYQLPVSYLAPSKTWRNSPGYNDGQADFDRVIKPRCLECHATWFATSAPRRPGVNAFDRDRFVLGISCEKCHGPGRRHVQYHREHPTADEPHHIVHPGSLASQRQIELCSLCHSGAGIPLQPTFQYRPGDRLDAFLDLPSYDDQNKIGVHSNNQVARLSKSRCFQAAGDMTCTTCHNPHRFERGNLAVFSRRCMGCHPGVESTPFHQSLGLPIHDNCIDCHLPQHEDKETPFDTPEATVYVEMRDHLIGVYPSASAVYQQQSKREKDVK